MNVLQVSHCDMLNGDGLRVVLWVSGCSHQCKGCQNEYSWDCNIGVPFDDKIKEEIFGDLKEEWCSGITFSGGDPLFEKNRADVIAFAKEIKQKFPKKNIWLYTGYTWSEILADETMAEVIKYVDVVCDGPYVESLRDVDKHWVGSSNQEVIDVKKRLEKIAELSK